MTAPLTPEPLVVRSPEDVLSGFSEYRKTALTKISDYAFPPGTVYQTPEGLRAEDEDTRCAVDVQGGVYPIRESVFRASYAPADAERAGAGRLTLTPDLFDDLGEVLAAMVYETNGERYVCRMCDSDVTISPHSDDCEVRRLREWTFASISRALDAEPGQPR